MLGLRFTVLFVSNMDFRGQRVRFRSSYDNSKSLELFHRPNRKWRFVSRLAGICLKAHSGLYRRRSTWTFSKKQLHICHRYIMIFAYMCNKLVLPTSLPQLLAKCVLSVKRRLFLPSFLIPSPALLVSSTFCMFSFTCINMR